MKVWVMGGGFGGGRRGREGGGDEGGRKDREKLVDKNDGGRN